MILKIVPDKHPSLRKICKKVENIDGKVKRLSWSMMETMQNHQAAGLAANQVGKDICMIALNVPEFKGVMINPEIIEKSEEIYNWKEGCLSIKKKFIDLGVRSKHVKVKWLNIAGITHEKDFYDFSAVAIQHEVDHLFGKLMTDYLK